MASFDDLETIANNAGFQGRVNHALQVAAENIMTEDPTTARHEDRVAFARKVINGEVSMAEVAQQVLTNATIAAEAVAATTPDFAIPDGDIQFAINSLFNVLAGIGS